jgi:adenylate cyclase
VEQTDNLERQKLKLMQRLALRMVRRAAGRRGDEPMSPEDWAAEYEVTNGVAARTMRRALMALPSSPRGGRCGAPFAGAGSWIVGPLGYRPSRKNPTICAVCVEASPPGGMKMYTGVLFADMRGFTARAEAEDPEEVSTLLRRFYRCAEDVLFPDAIIDKLMGDEVMALYLPEVQLRLEYDEVPSLMLEHARGLLHSVGSGSDGGPFVELGIGIDVGEAFVGQYRSTRPLRLHCCRRRGQYRLAPAGP